VLTERGKPKCSEKFLSSTHHRPQICRGLHWDWTWDSAVRTRRVRPWTMGGSLWDRPLKRQSFQRHLTASSTTLNFLALFRDFCSTKHLGAARDKTHILFKFACPYYCTTLITLYCTMFWQRWALMLLNVSRSVFLL